MGGISRTAMAVFSAVGMHSRKHIVTTAGGGGQLLDCSCNVSICLYLFHAFSCFFHLFLQQFPANLNSLVSKPFCALTKKSWLPTLLGLLTSLLQNGWEASSLCNARELDLLQSVWSSQCLWDPARSSKMGIRFCRSFDLFFRNNANQENWRETWNTCLNTRVAVRQRAHTDRNVTFKRYPAFQGRIAWMTNWMRSSQSLCKIAVLKLKQTDSEPCSWPREGDPSW